MRVKTAFIYLHMAGILTKGIREPFSTTWDFVFISLRKRHPLRFSLVLKNNYEAR